MSRVIMDLTTISRCGLHYRTLELEELGLSPQQASSIIHICQNPGISQDQLAHMVLRSKSNIARQVVILEDLELVSRKPNEQDKRIMQVFPTQKALDLLPRIQEIRDSWQAYLLEEMSPQELEAMEQIVLKVKKRALAWMEGHRSE